MFSREELIREANRLCSTIEDAERRYKDLQEQRDGLLAACKEALAWFAQNGSRKLTVYGKFELEHATILRLNGIQYEPIIEKLKAAIEKAEG